MYYVVQNNTFNEENYDNLIFGLERLQLPYEIVKIIPFINQIDIHTNRKDIFPFGSLTMSTISKNLGWYPGSQMNENHDFMIYKEYYKENLLNWDSIIIKFGDKDFFSEKLFFARPTEDTKVFTGKVFDMEQWWNFRDYALTNGHSTVLTENTNIQISSVKKILKEVRVWIVKGKIITASQYRSGNRHQLLGPEYVDDVIYLFCEKMIEKFQLNEAFVMDIAMIDNSDNGYDLKIIECGCINCAGFYRADLQKLLIALEKNF